MAVPDRARLVRIELDGDLSAAEGCQLVRGDERPFGLAGDWAGGGALVGSEPLVIAGEDDDPFELLDRQPLVEDAEGGAASGAVGGGWFGFLGYNLGARLERVPPPPPRHVPLPDFALAFYDHVLRLDRDGRWWFEALWTDERDAQLRARLELLRGRLAQGVRERPVWVGTFQPAPPGGAGHMTAIDECRERIAAGEIFQANLCLRLEAEWQGDPLDLFARTAGTLEPRHAGVVAGPWGAVCSLSPELFLRRRGREVVSEPIKGTAPRVLAAGREGTRAEDNRAALAASTKDRAENVMIVDLMRNDLGRVCEYGSISVPSLTEPRPAPGVWHLVSTVTGTLRARCRRLRPAARKLPARLGHGRAEDPGDARDRRAGGRRPRGVHRCARLREPGGRARAERGDPDARDTRRAHLDGRGRRDRGRLGRRARARGVLREGASGDRRGRRAPHRGAAREPRGPDPGARRGSRPARRRPRRVRDAARARRIAGGRPRAPGAARAQRACAVWRGAAGGSARASRGGRGRGAAAAPPPDRPARRAHRDRGRAAGGGARAGRRSPSRPPFCPAASARTSGGTAACSTSWRTASRRCRCSSTSTATCSRRPTRTSSSSKGPTS